MWGLGLVWCHRVFPWGCTQTVRDLPASGPACCKSQERWKESEKLQHWSCWSSCEKLTLGSAPGASTGTSTAVVPIEIFTLFLNGEASREEADSTEDGWGSGERSSGKSELGRRWRWGVRETNRAPQPLAVNRKSRPLKARLRKRESRRGEAATGFEL